MVPDLAGNTIVPDPAGSRTVPYRAGNKMAPDLAESRMAPDPVGHRRNLYHAECIGLFPVAWEEDRTLFLG